MQSTLWCVPRAAFRRYSFAILNMGIFCDAREVQEALLAASLHVLPESSPELSTRAKLIAVKLYCTRS